MRVVLAACVLLMSCAPVLAGPGAGVPEIPPGMKGVEGRYHYLIHDLTDEEAQEVLIRMEAMVEEYIDRTRDFSGRLNRKLPFMLFRNGDDYRRMGGPAGSAGVYMSGRALMAIAGAKLDGRTWHVIQHEGFHQFADAVIGGNLPIWVNEGLAEYFGEAIFTGSGFISGAVPKFRLERVQKRVEGGEFKTVQDMMLLSHERWNAEMAINNYDQAWAMVHFLAHGDDGKYQKAFGRFIVALNRGRGWEQAWRDTFGSAAGFQEKFEQWWRDDTRTPSVDLYARAATAMLTNYLARAASQKQAIDSIDTLLQLIEAGKVEHHKSDPLPPSLASECLKLVQSLQQGGAVFLLDATKNTIHCTLEDGTKIIGTYRLRGSRVGSVDAKAEK